MELPRLETPGGRHREDQNRSLQILAVLVKDWLEMFKPWLSSMISNVFYIFPWSLSLDVFGMVAPLETSKMSSTRCLGEARRFHTNRLYSRQRDAEVECRPHEKVNDYLRRPEKNKDHVCTTWKLEEVYFQNVLVRMTWLTAGFVSLFFVSPVAPTAGFHTPDLDLLWSPIKWSSW